MPDIERMCSNERILLGTPKAQKPGLRESLYATVRTLNSYYNRLSNTHKAWAVDEFDVDVTPGESTNILNAPQDFGKPLQVWVSYPENPAYVRRPIPFFEADSLEFEWGWPEDAGYWNWSPDGSPNTAVRCAFIRRGTQIYIRWKPTPQLSATYSVMYSVGSWASGAGFNDTPVLSNHHHLVEVDTAISLLPLAEWSDDKADNAERRKELALSLGREYTRYNEDFERFTKSLHQSHIVMMNSWNMGGNGW